MDGLWLLVDAAATMLEPKPSELGRLMLAKHAEMKGKVIMKTKPGVLVVVAMLVSATAISSGQATSNNPGVRNLLDQGKKALDRDDVDEAIANYRKALTSNLTTPKLTTTLALLWLTVDKRTRRSLNTRKPSALTQTMLKPTRTVHWLT